MLLVVVVMLNQRQVVDHVKVNDTQGAALIGVVQVFDSVFRGAVYRLGNDVEVGSDQALIIDLKARANGGFLAG